MLQPLANVVVQAETRVSKLGEVCLRLARCGENLLEAKLSRDTDLERRGGELSRHHQEACQSSKAVKP